MVCCTSSLQVNDQQLLKYILGSQLAKFQQYLQLVVLVLVFNRKHGLLAKWNSKIMTIVSSC